MSGFRGDRMRTLREAKHLSQDELAKAANLKSRLTIANYETNKRDPKATELANIAKALDTWTAYLMDESEDPLPPSRNRITPSMRPSFRAMTTDESTEDRMRLLDLKFTRRELLQERDQILDEQSRLLDEEIKALEEKIRHRGESDKGTG